MGIRIVMEKCLFVWKPGNFIWLTSFRFFFFKVKCWFKFRTHVCISNVDDTVLKKLKKKSL